MSVGAATWGGGQNGMGLGLNEAARSSPNAKGANGAGDEPTLIEMIKEFIETLKREKEDVDRESERLKALNAEVTRLEGRFTEEAARVGCGEGGDGNGGHIGEDIRRQDRQIRAIKKQNQETSFCMKVLKVILVIIGILLIFL